ncbi:hypothetical protein D7X74_21340 [Corallococcus sp. CA047B]|nr:hypothetical protein D7X74_21340 [Corallococcus sp. CA047B]
MAVSAPVAPAGPKVQPSEERCFRQVHPKFWRKGRLTEMAFRLKDTESGLSVSLESKTTPGKAFELYTKAKEQGGLGLPACGTWAVTTSECATETCDVYEDPTAVDDAHGSIDMRHALTNKALKKAIQTNLRVYAEERKFVHSPTPEPVGAED